MRVMKKLSIRGWISIVTALLIVALIYASRNQLAHAWNLLSGVNIGILVLVMIITAASLLVSGEMLFSYLRQKNLVKEVNAWHMMRISLELNFVNHILPSGGVSGVSYLNWRLSKLGVSTGKSTMAQAVRYVAGFAATTTLLAISVLMVTIDGNVNRWIILMSTFLVFCMVSVTTLGIYLIRSPTRMSRFALWIEKWVNRVVRKVTSGRVHSIVKIEQLQEFMNDMHEDYLELNRDRRMLIKPYLWGLLFTVLDILIFEVTFLALGAYVNPAAILIGYSIATIAGFAIVTPGGTGAYETVMVMVLATAGVRDGQAIAGVILSRVIILLVTIVCGYVFYQLTIMKYGKRPDANLQRQ